MIRRLSKMLCNYEKFSSFRSEVYTLCQYVKVDLKAWAWYCKQAVSIGDTN